MFHWGAKVNDGRGGRPSCLGEMHLLNQGEKKKKMLGGESRHGKNVATLPTERESLALAHVADVKRRGGEKKKSQCDWGGDRGVTGQGGHQMKGFAAGTGGKEPGSFLYRLVRKDSSKEGKKDKRGGQVKNGMDSRAGGARHGKREGKG